MSHRRARLTLALLLVGATLVELPTPARASAPANDPIAAATPLTEPAWTHTTNVGASMEAGEPQPSCSVTGATLWYRYTPTPAWTSDELRIHTNPSTWDGPELDTVIAVYRGTTFADFVEVGCHDDTAETLWSDLTVPIGDATELWIQIGSHHGKAGTLAASFEPGRPRNDDRANAETVAADRWNPIIGLATTLEPDEDVSCLSYASGTAWWRVAPDRDVMLDVQKVGTVPSNIALFDGNGPMACSDSRLTAPLRGGAEYWVQVLRDGPYNEYSTDIRQTTQVWFHLFDRPANDDRHAATPLPVDGERVTGTLWPATIERDEPRCSTEHLEPLLGRNGWYGGVQPMSRARASVWYSVSLADDAWVEVASVDDHSDPAYTDVVVAVYEQVEGRPPVVVWCPVAGGGGPPARFRASAGSTYLLQVTEGRYDLGAFVISAGIADPTALG